MAVRSNKLFYAALATANVSTLAYTCPAGMRTIVKGATFAVDGSPTLRLEVEESFSSQRYTIAAMTGTGSGSVLNVVMFVVLTAGDMLRIKSTSTLTASFSAHGAELLLP